MGKVWETYGKGMGNVWERYMCLILKKLLSYTEKTLQVRMIILQELYSVLLENPKEAVLQ
jgi:hypothetical protein